MWLYGLKSSNCSDANAGLAGQRLVGGENGWAGVGVPEAKFGGRIRELKEVIFFEAFNGEISV